MIRLREPYIKPPQIVDRLPEPVKLTSYLIPNEYAVSGVLNIIPNIIASSFIFHRAVNRFISASGYWHCGSNWSLGHVPNYDEDVVISGVGQVYCLVHGDVAVHDITVANRVYLDIGAHAVVQAHTLTLEPNAWLNLNSSNWHVSGDWITGGAHIDAGTSTINFEPNGVTYTNSNIITTTGVAFYGGVSGTNTS